MSKHWRRATGSPRRHNRFKAPPEEANILKDSRTLGLSARKRILVADAEARVCDLLAPILRSEGCEVVSASDCAQTYRLLAEDAFDLLFIDLDLPGGGAEAVLRHVQTHSPSARGVILTADGSAETVLTGLRAGAFDCLTKPLHADEIRRVVERARRSSESGGEGAAGSRSAAPARGGLSRPKGIRRLIGKSGGMRALNGLIAAVAPSDSTVLIRGESGTGKELVARALHNLSPRCRGPLVPVNCGAIPEELLESELFGHVKGSFTGAVSSRPGRFMLANGGTIFLDEIGDMSPKLQVKVLRVLQEQEVEPVGSAEAVRVDVRILAATNVDLERAVEEKLFREDLYYRLNVIPIEVPPLRERIEDVPCLVDHFIKRLNQNQPRPLEGFAPAAIERLQQFPWPGNVRELENLVERMCVLAREPLVEIDDLPLKFHHPEAARRRLAFAAPSDAPASTGAPSAASIASVASAGESAGSAPAGVPLGFFQPPAPPVGVRASEGVNFEERLQIGTVRTAGEPIPSAATPTPLASPPGADLSAPFAFPREGTDLNQLVDRFERQLILEALGRSGGVKSRAAELLGVKRTTLVEKMKKKNIVFERK
ncbi:MAG TPA: sigma-54 dependent transcriptional regulator [Sumerlaeia bacterium]|nr:sigma-54 dependent transcriptional regulator [Sumerlaeia bacterium]